MSCLLVSQCQEQSVTLASLLTVAYHGRPGCCCLSIRLLHGSDAPDNTLCCIQSLSNEGTKAMVHAFISCRLDYCNSLLTEISDGLYSGEYTVSPECCLLCDVMLCEHITQLHEATALAAGPPAHPLQANDSDRFVWLAHVRGTTCPKISAIPVFQS